MPDRSGYIHNETLVSDPPIADQVVPLATAGLPAPVVGAPMVVDPVVAAPLQSVVYDQAVDQALETEVMAVQPVVAAPAPVVTAVPVVESTAIRASYSRSLAPDAIVAALVGLFLLLVGLLAITRGGFDGPISTPVISVVGFTHTTLLGLVEITVGLCLLLSGAMRSRSGALFFGSALGIAAFVGAVQTESFDDLALESGFAWLLVIAAVAVVLTALFVPRYVRHSTAVYSA